MTLIYTPSDYAHRLRCEAATDRYARDECRALIRWLHSRLDELDAQLDDRRSDRRTIERQLYSAAVLLGDQRPKTRSVLACLAMGSG